MAIGWNFAGLAILIDWKIWQLCRALWANLSWVGVGLAGNSRKAVG
jgi:hypothetical protein